ncbi:hypothetical protein SAMN04488069_11516 [Hymenobacter psychrophilus]|uniref:Uncharacterized protein n=1 Tax=Hymenobacter psychrophilus TaxID=651662 RepID=A0A1H3N366_9BACT|nr:hypothetical protein SAMN04488069_11516 [Hymenobacter psychrophilus]
MAAVIEYIEYAKWNPKCPDGIPYADEMNVNCPGSMVLPKLVDLLLPVVLVLLLRWTLAVEFVCLRHIKIMLFGQEPQVLD